MSLQTISTAGLNGPILIMLTTDYYSHDHQQLLMPQGTTPDWNGAECWQCPAAEDVRNLPPCNLSGWVLAGTRQVCRTRSNLGTTGLATKVDHGYLQAFAAAAAVGGLGGLAQIGNSGSVLSASTRDPRMASPSSPRAEGEQVLNHFLNRLADHHAQGRLPSPRVHRD